MKDENRAQAVSSDNLSPSDAPPWMVELPNALRLFPHARDRRLGDNRKVCAHSSFIPQPSSFPLFLSGT
jgi:hypothetical protein